MPATAKYYNRIPKDHPAIGNYSAAMAYYFRNPKKCAAVSLRVKKNGGTKRYRDKYPNKYKAQTTVNNAIRDGKIFKSPCESCGSDGKINGHHDDYLKPLDIRWLCFWCHSQWHKLNGEALNP